jgi:hypothetical protein
VQPLSPPSFFVVIMDKFLIQRIKQNAFLMLICKIGEVRGWGERIVCFIAEKVV